MRPSLKRGQPFENKELFGKRAGKLFALRHAFAVFDPEGGDGLEGKCESRFAFIRVPVGFPRGRPRKLLKIKANIQIFAEM